MPNFSNMFRRWSQARTRKRELARLRDTGDDVARRLADAVDTTARRIFTDDEERWIDAIERLRGDLASSTETISHTDYGAGEPSDHLTHQQMEAGRSRTTSVARLCEHTSKQYPWAHLLMRLVRELRPTACLEMGTCLGFSGAYLAAALDLNGSGKLVTLEGAESLAALARRNFKTLGLSRVDVRVGRFHDTLEVVLQTQGPFGFAFVDGHHDGDATVAYFEQILPSMLPEGVFIFDDILWYESMRTAWRTIASHNHVSISVDLGVMGICVVAESPLERRSFAFRL